MFAERFPMVRAFRKPLRRVDPVNPWRLTRMFSIFAYEAMGASEARSALRPLILREIKGETRAQARRDREVVFCRHCCACSLIR
jgi:hypothetical protein